MAKNLKLKIIATALLLYSLMTAFRSNDGSLAWILLLLVGIAGSIYLTQKIWSDEDPEKKKK